MACEVLVNGDFSWNRSYFVLAGKNEHDACILRYLSPGDVSPRAQLHVKHLRIEIIDDVVMVNESATKTFWFLRSHTIEATKEWGEALKHAQRGDMSAFTEKVERARKATRLSSSSQKRISGRYNLCQGVPALTAMTSRDYADASRCHSFDEQMVGFKCDLRPEPHHSWRHDYH